MFLPAAGGHQLVSNSFNTYIDPVQQTFILLSCRQIGFELSYQAIFVFIRKQLHSTKQLDRSPVLTTSLSRGEITY